jgi:tetraacyldisaccharide 4'-kinase
MISKKYMYRVITDQEEGLAANILRILLLALSILYGFGVFIKTGLYQAEWLRPFHSSKHVISVGNLTLGGSGKTPLVVYIVKHLRSRGWRPAIVTRGYMPDGGSKSDEAVMLEELLPDVPVLAGPDRSKSIQSSSANVFILDDGFQHLRLKRDLDIVIIDAENPFGNGWLFPRGILREPLTALKRADLVVLSHVDTGRKNVQNVIGVIEDWDHKAMIAHTAHAAVGVSGFPLRGERQGLEVLRDRVCAVSAIGSPESFRKVLEGLGAEIAAECVYLDHHVYTDKDVADMIKLCRKEIIAKVVTTHKDAVKLVSFKEQLSGLKVLVLDVEMRVLHGENELLSSIDRVLSS